MKIMFIGDIVGEPGRKAVQRLVPVLIEKHQLDFVIANSENAAGGVGVTPSIVSDLLKSQVDVLTSGNHAWDKKEGIAIYDQEVNQLRPANYPTTQYFHTPGEGFGIFKSKLGVKIGVVNLIGCVFMNNYDCPFQAADAILEKMKGEVSMIIVDFHAETTSEKKAMALFLDGRVSAVLGTHTHVQTADEQILHKGTAFLTDAGMTGPHNSVIGMDKKKVLERFLTKRPVRFEVGKGDIRLQGAIIEIDESSGKAQSIHRVNEAL